MDVEELFVTEIQASARFFDNRKHECQNFVCYNSHAHGIKVLIKLRSITVFPVTLSGW